MQSHQVDFGRLYVVLQPINYQQIKKNISVAIMLMFSVD
jgi:hypothetical protein